MPFGHNCEYATFDDCVRDQMKKGKSEQVAQKICGSLQRDTEEQCKKKSASRAELKTRILKLEHRRLVIRKLSALDPTSVDAQHHAMGVKRERDLTNGKGGVDPGKWMQYVAALERELPQVDRDYEKAKADYDQWEMPPHKQVSLKLQVREPELETYATRHVNFQMSIPQSRALLAIQLGISSEHLSATSADALRYVLDQIASAM